MVIQSLKDLCFTKVFYYIRHAKYKNQDLNLDADLSNQLFQKFVLEDGDYTREICETFKNCQLSKIEGISHIDENIIAMINASENIEVLEIPRSIRDRTTFNSVFKVMQGSEGEVSVTEILKRLLCPKSQITLKKLIIRGDRTKTRILWHELASLAPNLQDLDIHLFSLDKAGFQELCDTQQNLKALNISHTGVVNLSPISKLTNLEILNIQGLHAKVHGLYALEKLKVLYMSERKLSRFNSYSCVELFASCGRGLPELRFLDVSCSPINQRVLEKLIKKNKSLEAINLIETELESTFQLDNKSIKILSTSTMENCLNALEYITKDVRMEYDKRPTNYWEYREHIFRKLNTILLEDQTESALREVYHKMFQFMIKFHDSLDVQYHVTGCLIEVLRENRSQILTASENHLLINALLDFDNENHNVLYGTDRSSDIESRKLRLLRNQLNSELPMSLIEKVFQKIEISLSKSQGMLEQVTYLPISAFCLLNMDKERIKNTYFRSPIKLKLIEILKFFDISTDPDIFRSILTSSTELSCYHQNESRAISQAQVRLFIKHLEVFKNDQNVQIAILQSLARLVDVMNVDVLKEFFTEQMNKCIRTVLGYKNRLIQTLIIAVSARVIKRLKCITYTNNDIDLIMLTLYKYEKNGGKYEKSELLRYVFENGTGNYSKEWARMGLSLLKSDVQPRTAEKRKADDS